MGDKGEILMWESGWGDPLLFFLRLSQTGIGCERDCYALVRRLS